MLSVGGAQVWHYRHELSGFGLLAECVWRPRRRDYQQSDWRWYDDQDQIRGSWRPITTAGEMQVVEKNNIALARACQEEVRRRMLDREEKARVFWRWVSSIVEEERRRRLYLEYCESVVKSVAQMWRVRFFFLSHLRLNNCIVLCF